MENAVNPLNAGGFSALIEVETLEGEVKRILLDSGWSYDWMDKAFKREGIDKLLAEGKIDYFVISHEHFDHMWAIPVTFKYAPTVRTLYPKGFYPEGLDYIKVAGHRGELIETTPGLYKLFPGAALYNFQTPIICRVFGEQSLFFNVKDKGLVTVTGCCHQGILQFASTAQRAVETKKLYGIYGGLHDIAGPRVGPEVRRPRRRVQELGLREGWLQSLHRHPDRQEADRGGGRCGQGHRPQRHQGSRLSRQWRHHPVRHERCRDHARCGGPGRRRGIDRGAGISASGRCNEVLTCIDLRSGRVCGAKSPVAWSRRYAGGSRYGSARVASSFALQRMRQCPCWHCHS